MDDDRSFQCQFSLKRDYYLNQLDFLNWFRYFFLVKEVIACAPGDVLEVGSGSGIVEGCLRSLVKTYTVLDINAGLAPDIVGDVRVHREDLRGRFDCVIIADVLEHVPFGDVLESVKNIHAYLRGGGKVLVTIPHRRSHFLFMTPSQKPHVVTVPTGFLSPGAFYRRFIKGRVWRDPHHCWELGDGQVKRTHVESLFAEAGFKTEKFMKLIYVDFWVLRKAAA